jgi:DNA-binding response OmpR family regulator
MDPVPDLERDVLAVGALRLRHYRSDLQYGAAVVALTAQESVLLTCLLTNSGTLVATSALQEALWPAGRYPPSNILRVLVSHLRHKLAQLQYPGGITTLGHQGYCFDPAPDRPAPRYPGSRRGRAGLVVRAVQIRGEQRYLLPVGPRTVPLTGQEATLLTYLRSEPGRLVSYARLLAAGWGEQPVPRNHLHVYIRRLRQGLAQAGSPWRIRTLARRGYILAPPPA